MTWSSRYSHGREFSCPGELVNFTCTLKTLVHNFFIKSDKVDVSHTLTLTNLRVHPHISSSFTFDGRVINEDRILSYFFFTADASTMGRVLNVTCIDPVLSDQGNRTILATISNDCSNIDNTSRFSALQFSTPKENGRDFNCNGELVRFNCSLNTIIHRYSFTTDSRRVNFVERISIYDLMRNNVPRNISRFNILLDGRIIDGNYITSSLTFTARNDFGRMYSVTCSDPINRDTRRQTLTVEIRCKFPARLVST